MLQTICNDIGKIMLEGCANAGRMMLLFTDTLKRISKADGKEKMCIRDRYLSYRSRL